MNPIEIKQNNPSICWTCSNARRCTDPDLENTGHVGCNVRWMDAIFWEKLEAEKIGEGGVCLTQSPFETGSCWANTQLITKGTTRCLCYKIG